jgi:outer membrane protein TolC
MRRIGAVVALLLMMIGTAGGETYRFTLEEAIAYGLTNSTAIKSKQLTVAAAQTDLGAAKSAYYPSLSAGASWTHLFDPPQSGPVYLSGNDPVGVSLELGQSIYTFGKIKGGAKLAEEAVAQAALDLAEENRKTIVLIKNAFYGYLLAVEVAAINEETLASKEEALEVARQRYNAGLVADFEVLQAESDLESFKATVISTDNGVRIALLNVKNVLGIEEEDFEFELIGELELIPVEVDREALIQTALTGKYDLQSFRKLMDITEAQGKLNRSLRLPTLAAWANYSVQSGFDISTGDNRYFDLDAWDRNLTMGLNLSVPISGFFPWSEESLTIKKTQLQVEDLRMQYGAFESSVRIAVESSILKIAEERAKISSGKKSVALAQRLYEAAVDQYESGYISSVELKDAQLGLNAARLAYAQAIYDYNRNILDLMDVVGVASF